MSCSANRSLVDRRGRRLSRQVSGRTTWKCFDSTQNIRKAKGHHTFVSRLLSSDGLSSFFGTKQFFCRAAPVLAPPSRSPPWAQEKGTELLLPISLLCPPELVNNGMQRRRNEDDSEYHEATLGNLTRNCMRLLPMTHVVVVPGASSVFPPFFGFHRKTDRNKHSGL